VNPFASDPALLDWLTVSALLVLLLALVARPWGRWRPAEAWSPRRALALDAGCAALLATMGLWWAYHLFEGINPDWIPTAQDFAEYSATIAKVLDPDGIEIYWNRSLLYPWLATTLVHGLGLVPYDAAIHLSLACTGLLPLAVFLVTRQLGPTPLALGSGLLVLHLPGAVERLGHVSDYSMSYLLTLLGVAAALMALRRPRAWTFLLAGSALTAVLACTPKGLTVALVALPFLVAGLPWKQPRHAALTALALAAPMAVGWWTYGALGIDHSSLEWGVVGLKETWAQTQGIPLTHADWGLPAIDGDPGTWRFGGAGALAGLPRTIAVMLHSPEGYPGLGARLVDSPAVLRGAMGLGAGWSLLALAPLGCLAVRAGCRPRWGLGAGFLLCFVVTQALGAHGVPLRSYYVVHLLALAPALLVAALWGLARLLPSRLGPLSATPLWLLPLLALALLHSGAGVGHAAAARTVGAYHFAFLGAPGDRTTATRLRRELAPGDVVLDATTHGQASDAYHGLAAIQRSEQAHGTAAVRAPGSEGARRFVVLDCAFAHRFPPQAAMLAQRLGAQPRFRQWAGCIYLDAQPGDPVDLDAPGDAPEAP
jgi:hypothetical protein